MEKEGHPEDIDDNSNTRVVLGVTSPPTLQEFCSVCVHRHNLEVPRQLKSLIIPPCYFSTHLTYLFGKLGFNDGEFLLPTGISTLTNGNIVVTDATNKKLHTFSSTGHHVTTMKMRWTPHDVAVTLDNVIVLSGTGGIGIFREDGTLLKCIDVPAGCCPRRVCVDSKGRMFTTTKPEEELEATGGAKVLCYSIEGSLMWSSTSAHYGVLEYITHHDGMLYVADYWSSCIHLLTAHEGQYVKSIGSGQLHRPWGVAVDRVANVLVTDGGGRSDGGQRVTVLSPDGQTVVTRIGEEDNVGALKGLVIAGHNVLISDSSMRRIWCL